MASSAPALIADLFRETIDAARYAQVKALPDPPVRYLIAFTPRSGSSYLCDVLKNTQRLGHPDESMAEQFIPLSLKKAPAESADEYLAHVLRVRATQNGVSGMKASWFQFANFAAAMHFPAHLTKLRYIYLTRRDMAAQAISLYRATATDLFHTNIEHSAEAWVRLRDLPYDYERCKYWHKHIAVQEEGWRAYFAENNIFPLCITYEEILEDVRAVAARIAAFIGRPHAAKEARADSIFRKLGDRISLEWACRFALERDAELSADQAKQRAQSEAQRAPPDFPDAV